MSTENSRADAVAIVEKEEGYWNRGHYYEGTRNVVRALPGIQRLPVGSKLYAVPPVEQPAAAPIDDLIHLTNEQIEQRRQLVREWWARRDAAQAAPAPAPADDARERIAKVLHYPDCWDTAAYPTLDTAVLESLNSFLCSECVANLPAPSPADERAAAIKPWWHALAAAADAVERSADVWQGFGIQDAKVCVEAYLNASRAASASATGAKLEKPAKVGGTRFGVGVKWSTVIGAAQRLYEYEVPPEKGAARIERARDVLDDIRSGKYTSSPAMAAEPTACKGKNCGSLDPRFHSAECFEEYEKTVGLKPAVAAEVTRPSGYAYRYQSLGGTIIRFNGGGEVNGSRPIEAVPYWFAASQPAQADARVGLTDKTMDTLKLAIGFIASSARQDRGEHVARIRALLDDDRA